MNNNALMICRDWWDITELKEIEARESGGKLASIAQVIALQVIKDIPLRQVLLKSQKFETLCIGIIRFYHMIEQGMPEESRKKAN